MSSSSSSSSSSVAAAATHNDNDNDTAPVDTTTTPGDNNNNNDNNNNDHGHPHPPPPPLHSNNNNNNDDDDDDGKAPTTTTTSANVLSNPEPSSVQDDDNDNTTTTTHPPQDNNNNNDNDNTSDPTTTATTATTPVVQPYSTRRSAQQQQQQQKQDELVPPMERRGTRATTTTTTKVVFSDDDHANHNPNTASFTLGTTTTSSSTTHHHHEAFASLGASFLDSLGGEDERRTRTRYLPDVEGFHMLTKSELKRDFCLVRSVVSAGGGIANHHTNNDNHHNHNDTNHHDNHNDTTPTTPMNNDDNGLAQSEDERASEVIRVGGGAVLDQDNVDLAVPSLAFVTPLSNDNNNHNHSIMTMTAFNPPRPPESVGPKKKHRMLRWERRPQDVNVNLTNYRKTVQLTRRELHHVQAEHEKVSVRGAILRTDYLHQLHLMTTESQQLQETLGAIQMECVAGADLVTSSRTRTRGAGKTSSHAMRDVLSMVKARGVDLVHNGTTRSHKSDAQETSRTLVGVGGLTSAAFVDWDRDTEMPHQNIASGWLLPGDTVVTPYGQGTTLHVSGPKLLNVTEAPPPDVHVAPPAVIVSSESMDQPMTDEWHGHGAVPSSSDTGVETKDGTESKSSNVKPDGGTGEEKKPDSDGAKAAAEKSPVDDDDGGGGGGASVKVKPSSPGKLMESILGPRVCVRLPFGIGYFPIDAVVSKEHPSTYSDQMLAARWKKMVKTALSVSTSLDAGGMTASVKAVKDAKSGGLDHVDEATEEKEGDPMDVDGAPEVSTAVSTKEAASSGTAGPEQCLPFGASLLPTASGRGTLVADTPVSKLEKDMNRGLYDGGGVFGKPDNVGVPWPIKEWEDVRQDYYTLQASVLHLRNQLYRQRRIRGFNELTFTACRNRSHRAEGLVKEMRADLKSLKNRLETEILDMGIDGDKAEELLASYYRKKENEDFTGVEATPPKRARKVVRDLPKFSPKQTRRRGLDNPDGTDQDGAEDANDQGDEIDPLEEEEEESGTNDGMENSSDDQDPQRAAKRTRYSQ